VQIRGLKMKIDFDNIKATLDNICHLINQNKSLYVCQWNDNVHESFKLFVTQLSSYEQNIHYIIKSLNQTSDGIKQIKEAKSYQPKIDSLESSVRKISI
jgi:conjugal transfer/entry exclusion protein